MRPTHPSGRPRRELPRTPYKSLPITREPRTEPLTPGLRVTANTTAIGFHIDASDGAEYDEDEPSDNGR